MTIDRTDREEPARTTGAGFPPMEPLLWPDDVPIADRSRWSRRTHLWLFALSGLCLALAALAARAGDRDDDVFRFLPSASWFLAIATLLNVATSWDERRGQPRWGMPALVGLLVLLVAFGGYTVWSANAG